MALVLMYGQPQATTEKKIDELKQLCLAPCEEIADKKNKIRRFTSVCVIQPQTFGIQYSELTTRQSDLNRQVFHEVALRVGSEVLVIVNCPCAFKSVRYELFCAARERRVVFCVFDISVPQDFDQTLISKELFLDISSRLEPLTDADEPVFGTPSDVAEFVRRGRTLNPVKATRQRQFKQLSIQSLLNQCVQKVATTQAQMGAVCNVFLYGDEYVQTKRTFQLSELRTLAEDVARQCSDVDNAAQAAAFASALKGAM